MPFFLFLILGWKFLRKQMFTWLSFRVVTSFDIYCRLYDYVAAVIEDSLCHTHQRYIAF